MKLFSDYQHLFDAVFKMDSNLLTFAIKLLAETCDSHFVEYLISERPIFVPQDRRHAFKNVHSANQDLLILLNLISNEGRIDILTKDKKAKRVLANLYLKNLLKIEAGFIRGNPLSSQEKFCIKRALFLISKKDYHLALRDEQFLPSIKYFMSCNVPFDQMPENVYEYKIMSEIIKSNQRYKAALESYEPFDYGEEWVSPICCAKLINKLLCNHEKLKRLRSMPFAIFVDIFETLNPEIPAYFDLDNI